MLARTNYIPAQPKNKAFNQAFLIWLLTCLVMTFLMAVIGAITRLTESGLSMVEWRPLIGMIPPLNEQEWLEVFAKYQLFPEYQKINLGMSLAEFKRIFFWEWFHRLWGQVIGFVFLIPLLIFSLKRSLPTPLLLKCWVIFLLGGLQGFIGWFMVKSGLIDNPHVSHFRLSLHLMLALTLMSLQLWTWLSVVYPGLKRTKISRHLLLNLGLIALTIIWGGFVAGLDAGKIYNNFPLMNGHWLPDELKSGIHPLIAMLETTGGVQFAHRCLALLTGLSIILFYLRSRQEQDRTSQFLANFQLILVCSQITLGILTLLWSVPVAIATLHQACALGLFLLTLIMVYFKKYPRLQN